MLKRKLAGLTVHMRHYQQTSTRLLIMMHVKHTIPYYNSTYNSLPEDEPSCSKYVEDIKN